MALQPRVLAFEPQDDLKKGVATSRPVRAAELGKGQLIFDRDVAIQRRVERGERGPDAPAARVAGLGWQRVENVAHSSGDQPEVPVTSSDFIDDDFQRLALPVHGRSPGRGIDDSIGMIGTGDMTTVMQERHRRPWSGGAARDCRGVRRSPDVALAQAA